jgi:hypothetical protein
MRFAVVVMGVAVVVLPGCEGQKAAPVGAVVPPDAAWELVSDDLDDLVGIVDLVGQARLMPFEPGRLSRSGLEAAGIAPPIAVAGRGRGGVVVTGALVDDTRLQAALAAATPAGWRRRRLVGRVDAVVDEADRTRALVRGGDGLIVAVVDPVDDLAEAALVEALATGALLAPARTSVGTTWRARLGEPLTAVFADSLEGQVEVKGRELTISARAPLRQEPAAIAVATALGSSSTSVACVADDRAMLTLHLPAVPGLGEAVADVDDALSGLPGQLDAFDGRLTIALVPHAEGTPVSVDEPASFVSVAVIGRPRAGGADGLRASLDEAMNGRRPETRTVGGRTIRSLGSAAAPWRRLSAIADDDVFALAIGADVVIDRVAAGGVVCPPSARLVTLQGPPLSRFIRRVPAELRLEPRLRAWTGLEDPLEVIDAVDELTLEARPTADGAALALRLSLSVRSNGPRP